MDFVSKRFDSDNEPVTICPLGDIQWRGVPGDVAEGSLTAHVERCLRQPNPWFLGMGDYGDFAPPSQRAALSMPTVRDSTLEDIQGMARDKINDLYQRILKPTRGRWLGLLIGHHVFQLRGQTTDHLLAELLEARVLGDKNPVSTRRGTVIVGLQWPKGRVVRIYATHGCGGSVYPHGPVLKLMHAARGWDADVFLIGHQSKQAVAKFDMIRTEFPPDGKPFMDHQSRFLVGTGAWSRGFQEDTVTYVEEAMLAPAGIGAPIINVSPFIEDGCWKPRIGVLVS